MSALAEQVAEAATATARRAETWEILAVERADTTVEVASGEPDTVRSAHEATLCLRVYRDGRVGTATTTQPDDIDALIDGALQVASYGPAAQWQPSRESAPSPAATPLDRGQLDTADVRRLADDLASLQRDTGLTLHGTISHTEHTVHRADPATTSADRHRFCHLSTMAEGRRNQRLQLPWTGWTRSATLPAGLRDWLSAAQSWDHLPADVSPPDRPAVLLSPSALHTLLTPLVTALGGTAVSTGRSFLADELGTPLLHSSISLVDQPPPASDADGTAGLAWPRTDDDGVPCAPLTLVDNGIPARIYHSRQTAAALGVAPTGHGFRGNALRRTVLRPATPVLNGATLHTDTTRLGSFADLVGQVEDGILIESLLGGQQRSGLSPVVEGRIRLGLVIRRGQVVGTVRPCTVALDLRDVLGGQFVAASRECWAVSRIWSGRLPFVLASTDEH